MIPLAKIPLPPHPTAMRTSRLLGEGRSFYHVMSRVVDRRRVFEAKDKEVFRKILRNQEAFTERFKGQRFKGQRFKGQTINKIPLANDLRDRQSTRFRLPKSPARSILPP